MLKNLALLSIMSLAFLPSPRAMAGSEMLARLVTEFKAPLGEYILMNTAEGQTLARRILGRAALRSADVDEFATRLGNIKNSEHLQEQIYTRLKWIEGRGVESNGVLNTEIVNNLTATGMRIQSKLFNPLGDLNQVRFISEKATTFGMAREAFLSGAPALGELPSARALRRVINTVQKEGSAGFYVMTKTPEGIELCSRILGREFKGAQDMSEILLRLSSSEMKPALLDLDTRMGAIMDYMTGVHYSVGEDYMLNLLKTLSAEFLSLTPGDHVRLIFTKRAGPFPRPRNDYSSYFND